MLYTTLYIFLNNFARAIHYGYIYLLVEPAGFAPHSKFNPVYAGVQRFCGIFSYVEGKTMLLVQLRFCAFLNIIFISFP